MSGVSKDVSLTKQLPKYTVKISKQKGIHMRVSPRGELVVHANPFCTKESIEQFVSLHVNNHSLCMKNPTVRLFGRYFRVKKVKGNTNHVSYSEDELIVQYKSEADVESVYKRFLKSLTNDVLMDVSQMMFIRFKDYINTMPTLQIRSMKSSWGVCHPDKNSLTLNSELVHYPVDFVEYVICHEMVHLLEPSHSKRFYEILSKVMPDYKRRLDLIETSEEKQYLM